jgi:hypothetical protein
VLVGGILVRIKTLTCIKSRCKIIFARGNRIEALINSSPRFFSFILANLCILRKNGIDRQRMDPFFVTIFLKREFMKKKSGTRVYCPTSVRQNFYVLIRVTRLGEFSPIG